MRKINHLKNKFDILPGKENFSGSIGESFKRQHDSSDWEKPDLESLPDKELVASVKLENRLREAQHNLKLAKARHELGELPDAGLKVLQDQEKVILKEISQRAKAMDAELAKVDLNIESKLQGGRDSLKRVYSEGNSNAKRIEILLGLLASEKTRRAIDAGVLTEEEVKTIGESIKSGLVDVKNEDDFVLEGFKILEPFMRKMLDPEYIRAIFMEGFTRARPDGLINYGIDDKAGTLELHIAYGRDMDPSKIGLTVLRDLKAVAEVVRNDDKIKSISGTSHVVSSNSDFFLRSGFQLEPIDETERLKYRAGDNRPILHAEISREDFLKRFRNRQ